MDRRTAVLSLFGLGATALTGCTPEAPKPPDHPTPSALDGHDRAQALQLVLDAAVKAARASDHAAFAAQISTADPAFVIRADQWFTTMAGLPWEQLRLVADGGLAVFADETRQAELGDRAWLHGVTADWQLGGDASAPARQQIWLTVREETPGVRLVSASDLPHGTEVAPAAPLWLQEPVRLAEQDRVAVLCARGADPQAWLARVRRATDAVRRLVPASLTPNWSGNLLLQVPSTRQGFERTIGVTPGSYADIAAAAWPMGPDARRAPVHVVINPDVTARLDRLGLDILLAHETTHVATHSPGSPAPTWLVEGYADHIAFRAYPRGRAAAAEALLRSVRTAGPPERLPTDAAFSGSGAAALDLTYAQAWLACWFVADRYGESRLTRLYAAADAAVALDRAVPSALGVSVERLLRDWRAGLVALAADPPW